MFKYIKKHWYLCILAPLFMIGEISMDLLQPDMMAQIVDDGILGSNFQLILFLGTKMILLVTFGGMCRDFLRYFCNNGITIYWE